MTRSAQPDNNTTVRLMTWIMRTMIRTGPLIQAEHEYNTIASASDASSNAGMGFWKAAINTEAKDRRHPADDKILYNVLRLFSVFLGMKVSS